MILMFFLAAQVRNAESTPSVNVAEPVVLSTETSQYTTEGTSRRSPEIPGTTNPNETATGDHDQVVIGGIKVDHRSSGTLVNIKKSANLTQQMNVDNVQDEAIENTTNTETPGKVTQDIEIFDTQTQPPDSQDPESTNMEVDDMQTHPGNAADPQSPTHSTHKIPVLKWLSTLLNYLQNVSDLADWQTLVLGLIEFEKLNPPCGVGFWSLNSLAITNRLFIVELANFTPPQRSPDL